MLMQNEQYKKIDGVVENAKHNCEKGRGFALVKMAGDFQEDDKEAGQDIPIRQNVGSAVHDQRRWSVQLDLAVHNLEAQMWWQISVRFARISGEHARGILEPQRLQQSLEKFTGALC